MTPSALTALIDATWPAASLREAQGWTIREGAGGGSRVSAATALTPSDVPDIGAAEEAMAALGQTPLFLVRDGEEALDTALAARGYTVKDPVTFYRASAETLATPPPLTCFEAWPPLAVMAELWAAGGIGPARLAVMDRVRGPKTAFLGRTEDRPAGVAFAALHDGTAMIHAIEVGAAHRRRGTATNLIRGAARWAARHGGAAVSLLVTRANPANGLYTALGMAPAAGYHYRIREDIR